MPRGAGGAPAAPEFTPLAFSDRLGCGGTSDVYALRAEAGSRFAGACAKVPRFATEAVGLQFRREAAALRALAPLEEEGAAVPRLLCEGERMVAMAARVTRLPWPLLVIAPAGVPFCAYVDSLVEGSGQEQGGAAADLASRVLLRRIAAADSAACSLLRTLRLAHARSLFHCDVRPANLVAELEPATGALRRVLLVDWGLAAASTEENVARRGVPAYAAAEVVRQGTCSARAQLDLVAVAYTWLSIAHGGASCVAPWVVTLEEPAEDTIERRAEWLREHVAEAAPVQRLLNLQPRRAPVEAVYTWQ